MQELQEFNIFQKYQIESQVFHSLKVCICKNIDKGELTQLEVGMLLQIYKVKHVLYLNSKKEWSGYTLEKGEIKISKKDISGIHNVFNRYYYLFGLTKPYLTGYVSGYNQIRSGMTLVKMTNNSRYGSRIQKEDYGF